jgi:hypothetical protein
VGFGDLEAGPRPDIGLRSSQLASGLKKATFRLVEGRAGQSNLATPFKLWILSQCALFDIDTLFFPGNVLWCTLCSSPFTVPSPRSPWTSRADYSFQRVDPEHHTDKHDPPTESHSSAVILDPRHCQAATQHTTSLDTPQHGKGA